MTFVETSPLLIFLKMLLPALACVLLVKMIVPRLGHRPTPHMSPTVNFTARTQLGSTLGSNWILLQREARTKLMPHPVDLNYQSVLMNAPLLPVLTVLTCWPAASGRGWAKSGLVSYILYLVCAKLLRGIELPGRGVKLAWPTLSNFWITLTDTVENSNVTTDHWPANVHLFVITCFNTVIQC